MLPFFLFGLMALAARPRQPNHLLLLLWVLATVAANMLVLAIITPRYPIVFPALAIVSAFGLATAVQVAFRGKTMRFVVWLLILLIGAWNVRYYWVEVVNAHTQAHNTKMIRENRYSLEGAILQLQALPAGTVAHIFTDNTDRILPDVGPYFFPHVTANLVYTRDENISEIIRGFPGSVSNVVFVERDDTETLEKIEAYYQLSGPIQTEIEGIPPEAMLDMYIVQDRVSTQG